MMQQQNKIKSTMTNKQNIQYLVTGGCSFSQPCNADITWPIHLEEFLSPQYTLHSGRGCADNTTIARLLVYNIQQILNKGVDPADLLVGIMWSGVDRHSIYNTRTDFPHDSFSNGPAQRDVDTGLPVNYHTNPLFIASEECNQYLIHANFEDQSSKNYWQNFYDPIGSHILSLENVLRIQWFLKSLNISYFMTEHSWYSIHDHRPPWDMTPRDTLSHPDVRYLIDLVDHEHWLPISHMTAWTEENNIPYTRPNDPHPSTHTHKQLVDQVILPHLQDTGVL